MATAKSTKRPKPLKNIQSSFDFDGYRNDPTNQTVSKLIRKQYQQNWTLVDPETRRPIPLDEVYSKHPVTSFQEKAALFRNHNYRHLPNLLATTSLFTVAGNKVARRVINREKLVSDDKTCIFATGIELRTDVELPYFMEILRLSALAGHGNYFEVTLGHILDVCQQYDKNENKGGGHYDTLMKSISRMKSYVLEIESVKSGRGEAFHLIKDFRYKNMQGREKLYAMCLDPELTYHYLHSEFALQEWQRFLNLQSALSKRIYAYLQTAEVPKSLNLLDLYCMTGSRNKSMASFKQSVKKALAELVDIDILIKADVSRSNVIVFEKKKRKIIVPSEAEAAINYPGNRLLG